MLKVGRYSSFSLFDGVIALVLSAIYNHIRSSERSACATNLLPSAYCTDGVTTKSRREYRVLF